MLNKEKSEGGELLKEKPTINSFLLYSPIILILINNFFLGGNKSVERAVLVICFLLSFFSNLIISNFPNAFAISLYGAATAIVSFLINGSGIGSFVAYSNLLMFIVLYATIEIEDFQKRRLNILAIISILLVVFVFSDFNSTNTYYYSILKDITAEHLNPNTMGMLCFFLGYFCLSEVLKVKNKKIKYLFGTIVFIIIFYLIYRTKARTSLFAFLLFIIAIILLNKKSTFFRSQGVFCFCIVFSFVLTFVYINLYEILGSITILDKNIFSGRQNIWKEAFSLIKDNLFFGYDNKYLFSGKFANAHNSLLSMLFMFGLIPTILAIATISKSFKMFSMKADLLVIKMIYCCIFIMIFESLLTDANLYYYFTLLFIQKGVDNDS